MCDFLLLSFVFVHKTHHFWDMTLKMPWPWRWGYDVTHITGSVGLRYIFCYVIIQNFPSSPSQPASPVTQCHQKYRSIGARLRFLLVNYSNFSLKLAVSEIIDFEKCRYLESPLWVTQGHWRWLHLICHCHSVVIYLLTFLTYMISKIPRPWNPDQGSLKVIETGTMQQIVHGFLLVFYRNFVPKTHLFEIFTFQKYRNLETGV